jgi:homocysteine S-methyltransferase
MPQTMRASWLQRLQDGDWLLLDGGTGSELRRRGVALRHDVWSAQAPLTHFEALRDVHADFIRAGADIITTNTFATTRFVLDAGGLGEHFAAVNRRAVEAARAARDSSGVDVAIAGSLSCLPPSFDVRAYPNPAVEQAAYAELAQTLANEGVDLLVLEMLQDTEHAARACEAVAATGLPFWVGVSCRVARDGESLVTYDFPDVRLETVLDALLPFEPAVACVMHSPAAAIGAALDAVARRWPGHVGAYPEWPAEAAGADDAATGFVRYALEWRHRGAQVLGGCCGVTPEQIYALRAAVAGESTVSPGSGSGS